MLCGVCMVFTSPLFYPLSTWPLYEACGAPAIRIGPVSLHSYLDSLSLCTRLSCLTQTLPRRMSLVNVSVNTTTFFTCRPFIRFRSQIIGSLCGVMIWSEKIWPFNTWLKTLIWIHCKNTINRFHISFSLMKLLLSPPLVALYGERRTRMRLTLDICSSETSENTSKKCQLAINLPPCSCPTPSVSLLILLFFLHLF